MATTQRGIVTPEAVVLEFDTAGIASRALARALDALIQAVLLLVVLLVAGVAAGGEGWVALVAVITGTAFVVLGYPVACEIAMSGRSPGKAALGLRVVTVEGAPIAPRHAFIRSAIGLVDFLLPPGGLVAVLVALFTARSQRLGDVFAGTIVLRERAATRRPVAVWFNPPVGLEGYAHTLDVSRVTDQQFGLVRSFLLRLGDLSPEARATLSVRLATPLTRAMAHQAPPGVYADQFLQCVAAAYQRRHAGPPTAGPTAASWAGQPPPPMAPPPPGVAVGRGRVVPPPPPPPPVPVATAPGAAEAEAATSSSPPTTEEPVAPRGFVPPE